MKAKKIKKLKRGDNVIVNLGEISAIVMDNDGSDCMPITICVENPARWVDHKTIIRKID